MAVKIQYPGLARQCWSDVRTIDFLVNIMAKVPEHLRLIICSTHYLQIFPEFKLKWLVDEFNRNLPSELNFVEEAKNSERVQKNFGSNSFLKAPKTYWNLTTPRVLTMEWIDGCKVSDLQSIKKMGLSPREVILLVNRPGILTFYSKGCFEACQSFL